MGEQAGGALWAPCAEAFGDLRRDNRGTRPLLSDDDLEALRERLRTPPDDGGQWSGPKVARWIGARLSEVATEETRAFDVSGDMVDADLIGGDDLEPVIGRLFANPEAAYIHAHYARRGCYAARIDRA